MSTSKGASLRKNLGLMLVEASVITEEQLQQAQMVSHKARKPITSVLVEQNLITPQQLAMFISLQLNVPFVNLRKQGVQSRAVELLPESMARRYGVMPLDVAGEAVVIAMEDPGNIAAIDELSAYLRRKVEPVASVPQDIQDAIDRNYRAGSEIEKQLAQIPSRSAGPGSGAAEPRLSADALAQAPVVRAIDLLIKQAVRDRASDVHLEPQEDHLRVRYRIDGILHETLSLPSSVHAPLTSRLKIMAGMNIAERRRPQDGQITYSTGDREVDIRAATANTIHGEMMVLRILDKTFAFLTLPELGFLPDTLEKYQQMMKTPFGMIIISGPTGSGKTTTLYASVNQLDSVGRNIITIEDPVEYHFGNINQIPVNPAGGVTFAAGLRACMRLDPNVILVGEIRDPETARIAIQAALTGHLVLSSVHANDTAGVVFRLVDLGVEPFLVASALIGIVAQRMVRRVCPYCSRPTLVTPEERLSYEKEMKEEKSEFLYGSGCNFCAGTGYQGRSGIFEVMTVSEAIRRLIMDGGSADDVRSQAYKEGTNSLWRDGMVKVQKGLTTPYEVMRNVYSIQ